MSTTAARRTNVPDYTTAYYFLEGLSEIGIDYLFCNFGTDHAPIINEMAHRKQRGEAMPGVVRCPHENTAAHNDSQPVPYREPGISIVIGIRGLRTEDGHPDRAATGLDHPHVPATATKALRVDLGDPAFWRAEYVE